MGTTGEGRAINSADFVTGQGVVLRRGNGEVVRSFFGNDDSLVDIGVLPGKTFTRAADVNDANQIIGVCHIDVGALPDTFLWQGGEILVLDDLADYPPGVTSLAAATATNSIGQIAGHTGGTSRGIILTPKNQLVGDVNIDCRVDATDLALLLNDWGPCSATGICLADFVDRATFQPPGDGVVDAADLAHVLGNWTGGFNSLSGRN